MLLMRDRVLSTWFCELRLFRLYFSHNKCVEGACNGIESTLPEGYYECVSE